MWQWNIGDYFASASSRFGDWHSPRCVRRDAWWNSLNSSLTVFRYIIYLGCKAENFPSWFRFLRRRSSLARSCVNRFTIAFGTLQCTNFLHYVSDADNSEMVQVHGLLDSSWLREKDGGVCCFFTCRCSETPSCTFIWSLFLKKWVHFTLIIYNH